MADSEANDAAPLAVMLRVAGWRCVIVGGGAVARRRGLALAAAGGQVHVVAPQIHPELRAAAASCRQRGYRPGDLAGARLVVTAADLPEVNAAAAREAADLGALVNRADQASAGELTFMGSFRRGPVTVGVDTGGSSAAAGRAIRDTLDAALDPAWPTLLDEARPWRQRLRQTVDDPAERARRIARLTDAAARRVLADHGVDALRQHLSAVADGKPGPADDHRPPLDGG